MAVLVGGADDEMGGAGGGSVMTWSVLDALFVDDTDGRDDGTDDCSLAFTSSLGSLFTLNGCG